MFSKWNRGSGLRGRLQQDRPADQGGAGHFPGSPSLAWISLAGQKKKVSPCLSWDVGHSFSPGKSCSVRSELMPVFTRGVQSQLGGHSGCPAPLPCRGVQVPLLERGWEGTACLEGTDGTSGGRCTPVPARHVPVWRLSLSITGLQSPASSPSHGRRLRGNCWGSL